MFGREWVSHAFILLLDWLIWYKSFVGGVAMDITVVPGVGLLLKLGGKGTVGAAVGVEVLAGYVELGSEAIVQGRFDVDLLVGLGVPLFVQSSRGWHRLVSPLVLELRQLLPIPPLTIQLHQGCGRFSIWNK